MVLELWLFYIHLASVTDLLTLVCRIKCVVPLNRTLLLAPIWNILTMIVNLSEI